MDCGGVAGGANGLLDIPPVHREQDVEAGVAVVVAVAAIYHTPRNTSRPPPPPPATHHHHHQDGVMLRYIQSHV